MTDPPEKPYDAATWQPEDGDPFKADRCDDARRALGDAVQDQFGRTRRRRSSAAGFLLDWLRHYLFPAPRR